MTFNNRTSRTVRSLAYIVLTATVVIIVIPVLQVFLSSFKTNEEINRVISLPSGFNLDNYRTVFKSSAAMYGLMNSVSITFAAMLLAVVLSSVAGYAMEEGNGSSRSCTCSS